MNGYETEIRLGIESIKNSLQSESLSSVAIKDNLATLISLITIINERILQFPSDLSKIADSEDDHKAKHLDILKVLQANLSDMKLLAVEIKEHRKDGDRLSVKADSSDGKLNKIFSLVRTLQDDLERTSKDMRAFFDVVRTLHSSLKIEVKLLKPKKFKKKNSIYIAVAFIGSPLLLELIKLIGRHL